MKVITILFFLTIIQNSATYQQGGANMIEKNGMVLSWSNTEKDITVEVKAPSQGWVAVGFNGSNELSGTNLIMGAVNEKKFWIDDRYIVQPGEHKSVEELGGKPSVRNASVTEEDGMTVMRFTLPLLAADIYHINLRKGHTYHVLLAYSVSDDFMHHSRMRTSISITL